MFPVPFVSASSVRLSESQRPATANKRKALCFFPVLLLLLPPSPSQPWTKEGEKPLTLGQRGKTGKGSANGKWQASDETCAMPAAADGDGDGSGARGAAGLSIDTAKCPCVCAAAELRAHEERRLAAAAGAGAGAGVAADGSGTSDPAPQSQLLLLTPVLSLSASCALRRSVCACVQACVCEERAEAVRVVADAAAAACAPAPAAPAATARASDVRSEVTARRHGSRRDWRVRGERENARSRVQDASQPRTASRSADR